VRETIEKGVAQVAMGGVPKGMKINHEETKSAKVFPGLSSRSSFLRG
jgi:hypothetical protein